MNEIGLEELRERVRQELHKWHNPKDGRTMQKIYAETGLATSNLRKILRGEANPSWTTCYRLLMAICPKEFVYDLLDQLISGNRVRALAPAKPTGLRIENREDAWFITKLSTAEKLSVDFVSTTLGNNYNVVVDKFLDMGYVSIDNGFIYASNTHNELLNDASVRNLGHFVLDSTHTAKDSDVMTYRAFRTTPEKAEKGKMILKKAIQELNSLLSEEVQDPHSSENFADFAFILACTTI